MLSSPQTNGSNAIFNPNHHLTLITQPVLGARSRKKHHIDSITSTHRTEYTHSPSIISPIKQVKFFKKTNFFGIFFLFRKREGIIMNQVILVLIFLYQQIHLLSIPNNNI
jgi:hypothetical protein